MGKIAVLEAVEAALLCTVVEVHPATKKK